MPTKGMLKKDVNRLLVEERKKMRVAQKESKFKQRTLTIYRHQKERAKELGREVQYTLDEFRDHVRENLDFGLCFYCGNKITVGKFVCDHATPVARDGEFTLDNTPVCCSPCNCQKGKMTKLEFERFNTFLSDFPEDVVRDIRMRLTIGGKWTPGK